MMGGIIMNIRLFLMLLALIIISAHVDAAVQIGTPSPSSVIIKNPTVSTTGGGSNSSGNFTQAQADALYWRLDASNDPPTSSWDMGTKGFFNIGNSTFSGSDYFYKHRGATMFYWNGTDGTKQNYHYLDPDNNAVDYIVDVVLGASNSLYINDVQYSKDGIFKLGGAGTDYDISNADPMTGGITLEGGMFDVDSNDGTVKVTTGASFVVEDLLNCDTDTEKLETDGSGTFYCGINPQGGNTSWNQSYANTLYAGIQWGYNQTTPAITDINSRFWNRTQTYNRTEIDAKAMNYTNVALTNISNTFSQIQNFSAGIKSGGDLNFSIGITETRSINFVNSTNGIRASLNYIWGTGANSHYLIGRNDTKAVNLNDGASMKFYDNTPGRLEIFGDTPEIRMRGMRSSGGTVLSPFTMYATSSSTNLSNYWGGFIWYGDFGSGSTLPTMNYMGIGVHNNTAYNNITLKVCPDDKIGINIAGTGCASYPLDVRRNVSGISIKSEAGIQAGNYYSSDGTLGITTTINVTRSVDFVGTVATYCQITTKNGLIVTNGCT